MPDERAAEAHIFLESESCCINESFVNKYTKVGILYAIGVVSELNNLLRWQNTTAFNVFVLVFVVVHCNRLLNLNFFQGFFGETGTTAECGWSSSSRRYPRFILRRSSS